jgi:hypothetical protein
MRTLNQVSIFAPDGYRKRSWIEDGRGNVIFDMGLTEDFHPEYMTKHLRLINLITDDEEVKYCEGEYKRKL